MEIGFRDPSSQIVRPARLIKLEQVTLQSSATGTLSEFAHAEEACSARLFCMQNAPGIRVLVVDDEDPQRQLLAEIVTALGFAVETAANGQEALEAQARVSADVIVTDPDGKQEKLALTATRPGRAVGTRAATTPGVWQASDGKLSAYAAAGAANPLELADLRATATLLGPLARASGGGVHWLDPNGAPELRRTEPDRDATGAAWIGLQRRHDHLVTGIAAAPLLPPWAALPLLLGLVVAAWRRESR